MSISLTNGQKDAVNKVDAWFNSKNRNQVFKLYGSAGTGKTFLIRYIIENVITQKINEDEIAFCAPTGKAASVMMIRFAYENISTIHNLIYHVETEEEVVYKEDGQTVDRVKTHTKFIRRPYLDGIKLIVVDEFSMVDPIVLKDLLSYDLPIIAIGDPFQLPPVEGTKISTEDADVVLTEIVRQSADNQIIRIATNVREGNTFIPCGNYNDQVIVYDRRYLTDYDYKQMLIDADQVICGMNKTKNALNKLIREAKGFKQPHPMNGDKLICKLNNGGITFDRFNLSNGIIGYIKNYHKYNKDIASISFQPDFYDLYIDNIIIDNGPFTKDDDYKYKHRQTVYNMGDNKYEPKIDILKPGKNTDMIAYRDLVSKEYYNKHNSYDEFMLNRFEYGYAISCHASQGSEFDTVVVIDESYVFKDAKKEWLYTAITRAKKKVIIIK